MIASTELMVKTVWKGMVIIDNYPNADDAAIYLNPDDYALVKNYYEDFFQQPVKEIPGGFRQFGIKFLPESKIPPGEMGIEVPIGKRRQT
ncbi:MAG: flagellar assembly protein FliH [Methanomicrobiales archaeon]|nr:flagellar assembly protein FliH [Methanomicrobiales archaeon]